MKKPMKDHFKVHIIVSVVLFGLSKTQVAYSGFCEEQGFAHQPFCKGINMALDSSQNCPASVPSSHDPQMNQSFYDHFFCTALRTLLSHLDDSSCDMWESNPEAKLH